MTQKKQLVVNFGTDGIRGKSDQHPFDEPTLFRLGRAIAKWATEKYNKKHPQIIIGHDTRQSCTRIKTALENGLLTFPIKIIDAQVLPTPAIYQLIQPDKSLEKQSLFDCGIMISASHNPYQDNGIKLFDSKTGKLNKLDEEIIIKNYNEKLKQQAEKVEKVGSLIVDEQCYTKYKNNILSFFPKDFLSGLKIALDCANGATYKIAPDIFETLGATVIKIAANPNGTNINYKCGALHPENLQKAVLQKHADIGFAFDGDGDRVIAINKSGQIKDGDDILAILTQNSKYKNCQKIVGTIMTNKGLETFFKEQGKKLIRTKVGDKYVAKKLTLENSTLGGEASGHLILKDYLNTGDGIFVALKTTETVINSSNWELDSFDKYPQILINVTIEHKKDLSQPEIINIIEQENKKLINGRIVIRYSGTENLLRIMVEDKEYKSAQNIAQNLADKLQTALKH